MNTIYAWLLGSITAFGAFVSAMFSHETLQTIGFLCGIASAVLAALHYRAARKKSDAELVLLKMKIKRQKLRTTNDDKISDCSKCSGRTT